VLWTCLAGGFATTFTITILGVSLKTIALDLESQVSMIAWVMTAPMLAHKRCRHHYWASSETCTATAASI